MFEWRVTYNMPSMHTHTHTYALIYTSLDTSWIPHEKQSCIYCGTQSFACCFWLQQNSFFSFPFFYPSSLTLLDTYSNTNTHTHATVGCVWYPYWSLYPVCLYRGQLVDCFVSKKAILPCNTTQIPLYLPGISNRFALTYTSIDAHICRHTSFVCTKYVLGQKSQVHTHIVGG